MRLPEDKLTKLMQKKQLERLAGTLWYCSKLVSSEHTFSHRIYDLMTRTKQPYYKISLSRGFQEYIEWWIQFSEKINDKPQILGKFATIQSVYSDASCLGYGPTSGYDCAVHKHFTTVLRNPTAWPSHSGLYTPLNYLTYQSMLKYFGVEETLRRPNCPHTC